MAPAAGQVKIKTSLASDLPHIDADGELLKRLLNNLIKNAVEASHDTGTVTVITQPSETPAHRIKLIIEDQGEGMDEETQNSIFQPYFTTKRGGTGLGLVLVRKIIDDHDGDVSVESILDQGTRFIVRL
jgi:signal transduction histidine kinase